MDNADMFFLTGTMNLEPNAIADRLTGRRLWSVPREKRPDPRLLPLTMKLEGQYVPRFNIPAEWFPQACGAPA
jgi:hypothetical protein